MITIKRLSACTFQEALEAWNEGFKGYFFDMTQTMESFVNRFANDKLSPTYSVVAFDQDKPIGLILNGIKQINGQKVSWNGGTGVAPEYRQKGVGKLLMEETLKIYQEENVSLATLEAVSENTKAISLYERLGYKVINQVYQFKLQEKLTEGTFPLNQEYHFYKDLPQVVQTLPFYDHHSTWQTQWFTIQGGEAIILRDDHGTAIGYTLYKKVLNESGQISAIVLYQCQACPSRNDQEQIINSLLHLVYQAESSESMKVTVNLKKSNSHVVEKLIQAGFEKKVEQVFMEYQLK